MDLVFRAQAAAGDAALAVLLREHLSIEVRDALAAPWTVVFGSPFEERVAAATEGTAHPPAGWPAA
jgi:hypothetical protein